MDQWQIAASNGLMVTIAVILSVILSKQITSLYVEIKEEIALRKANKARSLKL